MFKSVIFDAYGTLIDTKDGSVKAAESILIKNKCNITDRNINPHEFYKQWKFYHRKHIDELSHFIKEEEIFLLDLKKLYNEYGIDGNYIEDVKIMLSTLGKRTAYEETNYVLNKLKDNYKVYIGSTTDTEPLLMDIENNEIIVNGIFTSESLKVYKPNSKFFIKILNSIKMEPEDVVYIGDSQIDDLLGPSSIGIKTIWINRKNSTLNKEIPNPIYEIKNLKELLKILL